MIFSTPSDDPFIPSLYYLRQNVRKLVNAFEELWPNSAWGPAHIAISDFNLLDSNLAFCRGLVRGMLRVSDVTPEEIESVKDYDPHDPVELQATLLLFDLLALVPEEWRDVHDWKDQIENNQSSVQPTEADDATAQTN